MLNWEYVNDNAELRLFQSDEQMRACALLLKASERFTSRQRDVFNLVVEGESTKDIARRLNISPGTVKVHLVSVYRVLGCVNANKVQDLAIKACGGLSAVLQTKAIHRRQHHRSGQYAANH